MQGEKLRQEKRYREAAAEYAEAFRLAPEPLLLLDAAACYRLAGELKEARSALERYLELEPVSPFRLEVERQLEAIKKAQKKKGRLDLSGDEEAAKEAYTKGEEAYQDERFEEAAGFYASAYLFLPAPLLLFNIAQSYRFAEDKGKARLYYQRFLERIPEEPEADTLKRASAAAKKYLNETPAIPALQPACDEGGLFSRKEKKPFRERLNVEENGRTYAFAGAGALGVAVAAAAFLLVTPLPDASLELP